MRLERNFNLAIRDLGPMLINRFKSAFEKQICRSKIELFDIIFQKFYGSEINFQIYQGHITNKTFLARNA